MTDLSLLFPIPRKLEQYADCFTLPSKGFVSFEGDDKLTRPASRRLMKSLGYPGWKVLVGRKQLPVIRFCILSSDEPVNEQSYSLRISSSGIVAEAHDSAGLFYAAVTLSQIIKLSGDGNVLPCCEIEDWPDFPVRGVVLDISRDKMPTRATLTRLIDQLANLKFNHVQLYIEHTFTYTKHAKIWNKADPLFIRDIRYLDEYCTNRSMEFVPYQSSFGHMERWLSHPRYKHLAELPQGGAPLPWGGIQEKPSTLCPTDPATLEFLAGLYDEYLPLFTTRLFNVGCDEPFDLRGKGRSQEQIEQIGEGRVYLNHLLNLHKMVGARGFSMAYWSDMILRHPEILPDVPKDALVLEWGYEADHPFDARAQKLAEFGLPFCVCPGTSSWNSLAGRTDNMLENLTSAAESGLKHGAIGYIVCDWGDWGHWHPLSLSYPGFVCAAGLSWNFEVNRNAPWSLVADTHLTEGLGQILFDLGKVYRLCGVTRSNGTELFHILSKPLTRAIEPKLKARTLLRVRTRINEIAASIPESDSVLTQELRHVIRLMLAACHKGIAMLDGSIKKPEVRLALQNEIDALALAHQHIWLLRNAKGGLSDSLKRFERIRDELDEPQTEGTNP